MAHALAPNARQGDFDAALLADDALVLHALVLAAQALIVLDRTEDAGAEQAVTLGLERAVVDRLGLLDLAERPGADALRRSDADADRVGRLRLGDRVGGVGEFVHLLVPSRGIQSLRRTGGGGAAPPPIPYSAASAKPSSSASVMLSSSTLRPSERISLTSTLKL